MRLKKLTYILASGSLLAAAAACTDDYFDRWGGSNANSNVVTYSPTVGRSVGDGSRSAEPEYQPLILTGDRPSDSLYLHTFAVNKIGYQPGESTTGLDSRGNPIEDIDSLITYHTNFKVHAQFSEGDRRGEEYIEWSDTKVISADKRIWNTGSTNFWPSQEKLAFHAVSPSSEFNSLEGLRWDNDSENFSMAFDYEAKKSSDGKSDANVQPDLLVAASECTKAEANRNYSGHAPLKFHHALSAIKFAIRDVANGKIKDITIKGVHSQGHCTYTAKTDGSDGQFVWSDVTGTQDYTQEFNYSFTQDGSPIAPDDASHDIEMWATMPSKTFMLIPQQIPENAEIVITLERDRGAGTEPVTLHGNIVKNSVTEWKPGYEYVYTISTSNDNWVYVLEACGNHDYKLDANQKISSEPDTARARHYNDFSESPVWHPNSDLIFVFAPMNTAFDDYEEHGHFHVRSFRYRVNNMSEIEDLPWKADYEDFNNPENNDIRQYAKEEMEYWPEKPGDYKKGRDLPHDSWIIDREKVLSGNGSHEKAGEEKRFEFAAHNLISDWPGDLDMQDLPAYSGNSEDHPWDLSTAGDQLPQNTANTYVIDRQGWYIFPCVYGNAIKDGKDNYPAYQHSGGNSITDRYQTQATYQYLKNFVDYGGKPITQPWINEGDIKDVVIAWADVYNAISDISIIDHNGHKYIKFKANQYNLVQGNVVIAIIDGKYDPKKKPAAVWSWQIWINEHWLDSDRNGGNGQSHAFNHEYSGFKTYSGSKTGRRQRGDLEIQIPGTKDYFYWISPVNLGWCDPKSQNYLRRVGYMNFEQYRPGGTTKTGKTARLGMFQNGLKVDYKFGNNTYYQFGRKEPMVGYVDHNNNIKRNFGKYQYFIDNGPASLSTAIQRPNTLFGSKTVDNGWNGNDWLPQDDNWINLWNNTNEKWTAHGTATFKGDVESVSSYSESFICNAIKTVYDPCPPGYMVPPAGVWRIIGTDKDGSYANNGKYFEDISPNFNGYYLGRNATKKDEKFFAYDINADGKPIKDVNGNRQPVPDTKKITLASTGHRWYTNHANVNYYDEENDPDKKNPIRYKTGDNFNSFCVYLWSSTPVCFDKAAYCVALGKDSSTGSDQWVICAYFRGRRSMARPIRPVREAYRPGPK